MASFVPFKLKDDHPMAAVMTSLYKISKLENDCAIRCCMYADSHKDKCKDVTNLWEDGRLVLGPMGADCSFKKMSVKGLFFVCFSGALTADDPKREERWAADQKMCEEMTTMSPSILAYISIPFDPAEPNGEWFNLVLFDNIEFINTFEKSQIHKFAKEALSSDSFTHVSVRRGVVEINDHEEEDGNENKYNDIKLNVTRSVMITYGFEGEGGKDKCIKMERKVYCKDD
jgi:hypothetical protein